MKHILFTLLFLPTLLLAQGYDFELVPDAFPVEIDGWQPFQPWAGGIDNSTPEFCDIDADGDLDYFCGTSWWYYWHYENVGNSQDPEFMYVTTTFDSLVGVGIGALYQSSIDFGDIDDDSDQDAFISNGIIGLTTNIGSSSQWNSSGIVDTLFDQYGDYVIGVYFTVEDIDSDGDIDIIGGFQASSDYGLRLYENEGTPQNAQFSLVNTAWQGIQIPESHQNPCFGDLDGDNDLDLLVGTGEGNIYYYRNDGDSANALMTYVTNEYFEIDVGVDASPELADIDDDGDLDLFVGRGPTGIGNCMGDVNYYENIGDPYNPDFQFITTNYMSFDIGHYSMPRLVDIDADEDPDLFTKLGSHIALFRNQGTLTEPYFVYETYTFENIQVFSSLVPWFCDIDDDDDYDLFIGPGTIPGPPGLQLYINQGTPRNPDYYLFSDDLVPGVFTQSSVVLSPVTADIDADGDLDLFVSDDDGLLYFFENIGTSTQFQFQYITDNWQNINYLGAHRYFCFYDIDDDQDLDLFYYGAGGGSVPVGPYLQFYRNIGTPQNAQMVLENEDLFPELLIGQPAPYLFDMDQDGDGDMFVGDTWGGIRYFENIYDSSSANPPNVALHPRHGTEFTFGPNPANPITWVTFNLTYPQKADLAVYNLLGQRVATLASGYQMPGTQTLYWNASDFSSGVYLVKLQTENAQALQKVVILE